MKEEANCNDNVCTREALGEVGSRRIYLQLNLKFVTDVLRARTGRGRPSCIMMHDVENKSAILMFIDHKLRDHTIRNLSCNT